MLNERFLKKNTCKTCEHRTPLCHATCDEHKKFSFINEVMNQTMSKRKYKYYNYRKKVW